MNISRLFMTKQKRYKELLDSLPIIRIQCEEDTEEMIEKTRIFKK
ncbi:hypothetical protein [Helicobacter didelphidarum]|nr:hypothetical protein [Helicobacter didelphidarum]